MAAAQTCTHFVGCILISFLLSCGLQWMMAGEFCLLPVNCRPWSAYSYWGYRQHVSKPMALGDRELCSNCLKCVPVASPCFLWGTKCVGRRSVALVHCMLPADGSTASILCQDASSPQAFLVSMPIGVELLLNLFCKNRMASY